MRIIGITGTLGAGKGEVVNYLVEKYGFKHFSAREFIIEEIKRRGLPVNRDTTTPVANDLRAKYGSDYIAKELFKRAVTAGGDAIIESIRTVGEAGALRATGKPFTFLAVDADKKLRFERVHRRKSELDDVTFEKFVEDEKREMTSTDPTKQNLSACIALADVVIQNNGTLEELHAQVDTALGKITI